MSVGGAEKRRASAAEVSGLPVGYAAPVVLGSRSFPMLLSTVYRCVDLLSGSLAVLPLLTYETDGRGFRQLDGTHPVSRLLQLEPNEQMTAFTFFKTMVSSMILTGNAYAYIDRGEDLRPEQLVFIPTQKVGVVWVRDSRGIERKRYQVAGMLKLVEPKDMIHILNFSYDGITGVSTLQHARQTLGIATDSEENASSFLKSGGSLSGVLNVQGPRLSKEQREQIYKTWEERTGHGGVAVLEGNMNFQAVSVSPRDAQLLESRAFNVIDICRFFGVSPVKAFDLTKSSYSTVEATQIEYLTDTVQPIIRRFEDEFNRKLFLPSEGGRHEVRFDTSALLRSNKDSQGNFLRNMFYIGGYTMNEIRRELGMPRVEGGDEPMTQVNMQPMSAALRADDGMDNGTDGGAAKEDGE